MVREHNPGSIPLLSLDAVAFDSETTGLDTSKARMIQLGAVRIVHGQVDTEQSFQQLINPGLPIPKESQAIHGISDADVAEARVFSDVDEDFETWRQDSVLIGYASGFDLAMLKREGRLRLKPLTKSVTYHDPCQISRRGGATGEARFLLSDFAQDFREMAPTGNANWCCGGGGGVAAIASATELRRKVFEIKMQQVEETGARSMVSACANCRQTLDDGKAHYPWDREIDSLVEIIADHLIEA